MGIVLFLFTIFASLPAWAVTKGFIIYSEYAISDPRVIEFETISWKDGVEGKITKPNGKEDTFVNAWAKNFVYFDRAYFNLIDGVPGFKPMRAFIKGREVVVESNPQETADPDSADRVALDVIALEALQKKFPLFATNLEPTANSLRSQLARYKRGEQKQGGIWLTADQVAVQKTTRDAALAKAKKQDEASSADKTAVMKFSFTTLGGKTYNGVALSVVDNTGFTIIGKDGVEHVNFTDLLEDISDLPPQISNPAQALRNAAKERVKELEIARQRTEEQKTLKETEAQNRVRLAKAAGEEQKKAAYEKAQQQETHVQRETTARAEEQARVREAEARVREAEARVREAEARAREAEARRVQAARDAEAGRSQASLAAGGQDTQAVKPAIKAVKVQPAKAQAAPLNQSQRPIIAVILSIFSPMLIICIYIVRFKRQLERKPQISAGIGLYVCGFAIGMPLEGLVYQSMHVDTASLAPIWFWLPLGVIAPVVCCALAEALSRVIRKRNLGQFIDPVLAATYAERGLAKYQEGNRTGAVADYNKAICLNPEEATAYNIRGNLLNDLGDQNEAIADYTKAIELDPECAVVFYNRGNALHDKGKNTLAIADYTKAIELDPNCAEFYNNRGIAHTASNNTDQAIADFTRAIELNPLSANAYTNRGSANSEKGDDEAVIADYCKAVELDSSLGDELTPKIKEYIKLRREARQPGSD